MMYYSPSKGRRFHAFIALFLVALYVVAATRFLVPGLCVGMCAPLPSGGAASFNAIQACCATSMPLGGPAQSESDHAAAECAFCALLTAPGAPAPVMVLAEPALNAVPIRVAFDQAAHSVQVHAPGMPRDPPFAAQIL